MDKIEKQALSLEALLKELNLCKSNLDEFACEIMFVKRNGNSYTGYMLNLEDNSIKENVKRESMDFLIDQITSNYISTGSYDYTLNEENKLPFIHTRDVLNTDVILNLFTCNINEKNTINSKIDFDKLSFIVVKMCKMSKEHKKEIVLFKSCYHQNAKIKKSMKLAFTGNVPKIYNKPLLAIGNNTEVVLLDNYYYILNTRTFNSVFRFQELFRNIIAENNDKINNTHIFQNADQFIDDCSEDGRYSPRLAKAILLGCFDDSAVNNDLISKTKELFKEDINLNLNENGEIVYSGKGEISSILNILQKHYVISPITQEKMIAKAIDKYYSN